MVVSRLHRRWLVNFCVAMYLCIHVMFDVEALLINDDEESRYTPWHKLEGECTYLMSKTTRHACRHCWRDIMVRS